MDCSFSPASMIFSLRCPSEQLLRLRRSQKIAHRLSVAEQLRQPLFIRLGQSQLPHSAVLQRAGKLLLRHPQLSGGKCQKRFHLLRCQCVFSHTDHPFPKIAVTRVYNYV